MQFERWRVYCPRCRAVFVERMDWLAKRCANLQPRGLEPGTCAGRIVHGIGVHSTSTSPFFSAMQDDDASISVPKDAKQACLSDEPG